jgi:hypothetical protein
MFAIILRMMQYDLPTTQGHIPEDFLQKNHTQTLSPCVLVNIFNFKSFSDIRISEYEVRLGTACRGRGK